MRICKMKVHRYMTVCICALLLLVPCRVMGAGSVAIVNAGQANGAGVGTVLFAKTYGMPAEDAECIWLAVTPERDGSTKLDDLSGYTEIAAGASYQIQEGDIGKVIRLKTADGRIAPEVVMAGNFLDNGFHFPGQENNLCTEESTVSADAAAAHDRSLATVSRTFLNPVSRAAMIYTFANAIPVDTVYLAHNSDAATMTKVEYAGEDGVFTEFAADWGVHTNFDGTLVFKRPAPVWANQLRISLQNGEAFSAARLTEVGVFCTSAQASVSLAGDTNVTLENGEAFADPYDAESGTVAVGGAGCSVFGERLEADRTILHTSINGVPTPVERVNTAVGGTYRLQYRIYSYSDITEAEQIVNVGTLPGDEINTPVISAENGWETMTMYSQTPFDDTDVTAVDDDTGTIALDKQYKYRTDNTPWESVPQLDAAPDALAEGEYLCTYNAVDSAGNRAKQQMRTILVKKRPAITHIAIVPDAVRNCDIGAVLTAEYALTCEEGETPTISYQWQVSDRDNGGYQDIPGAVQAQYEVRPEDFMQYLRVCIRANTQEAAAAGAADTVVYRGFVQGGNLLYLKNTSCTGGYYSGAQYPHTPQNLTDGNRDTGYLSYQGPCTWTCTVDMEGEYLVDTFRFISGGRPVLPATELYYSIDGVRYNHAPVQQLDADNRTITFLPVRARYLRFVLYKEEARNDSLSEIAIFNSGLNCLE